jgi:predicted alpha/beta-fold hydrolase
MRESALGRRCSSPVAEARRASADTLAHRPMREPVTRPSGRSLLREGSTPGTDTASVCDGSPTGDRSRARSGRARTAGRPRAGGGRGVKAFFLPRGVSFAIHRGATVHVDIDGVGIEYDVTGEGPPVVLLHGFPDSGPLWRHQVPVLAEAGFKVVVPDMRGYGRSDKPLEVAAYTNVSTISLRFPSDIRRPSSLTALTEREVLVRASLPVQRDRRAVAVRG